MIRLKCAAVRRRLAAFHDGELPLADQVTVRFHLQGCPACAAEAARLRTIGEALRASAARLHEKTPGDVGGLAQRVIVRVRAEYDQSLGRRLSEMFADLRLVWVGLGATSAAAACLILMVGLLQVAARQRADSLAAVLGAMARPGSNENPVRVDGRMRLPHAYPDEAMARAVISHSRRDDAVFALAAVITREGRITRLELLVPGASAALADAPDRRIMLDVLSAASQTRFRPAQFGGTPVAVNMVWLLAHTTVRGKLESHFIAPRKHHTAAPGGGESEAAFTSLQRSFA